MVTTRRALHIDTPPMEGNTDEKRSPFFSSPFSSTDSNTSPVNGLNDPPLSPSMLEAARYDHGKSRQGLLSRTRARLSVRTVQRRLIWIAIITIVGLFIYTRDRARTNQIPIPIEDSPSLQYPDPAAVDPHAPNPLLNHDDSTAIPWPVSEEEEMKYDEEGTQLDAAFDASLSSLREREPRLPRPKQYSPYYGGPSKRPIDIASDPLPLSATLEERLRVWRNAPGGRGEIEGEVELGGFMQWNLEECNTIEEQHNTHMIQVGAIVWASLNRSSLHTEREKLITHMETLIGSPKLQETGTGRGIVMQAGNSNTLRRAFWSIKYMRQKGCTLPVRIYHFPEERPAEDDPLRDDLIALNATLVEASGQKKDSKGKSYHLKAIAMIENPFAEVLYLDSDNIPARDPEYMFEAPSYKRLRIFATPDYWKTAANNPIWAIMGVKCRQEWEMETGQMYIDKRHHLDVLWLIRYMLEHHADEDDGLTPGYFRYSDGDKDLFRWAMLMLRKRWAVPGRWVAAGALPGDTQTGFCGHTMLQHDAWGRPLFVHYNLLKQIPSGVYRGFCFGRSKQLPLFNTFPASPSTARLGEPLSRPNDTGRRGLGDIDCDMLADADEYGVARAPATEMVMRRAVRERGAKAFFHGGGTSAFCIDLKYVDPRTIRRKKTEEVRVVAEKAALLRAQEEWDIKAADAREKGLPEPEAPLLRDPKEPVLPDWGQSPLEVVSWDGDDDLRTMENALFDFGFEPGGT